MKLLFIIYLIINYLNLIEAFLKNVGGRSHVFGGKDYTSEEGIS